MLNFECRMLKWFCTPPHRLSTRCEAPFSTSRVSGILQRLSTFFNRGAPAPFLTNFNEARRALSTRGEAPSLTKRRKPRFNEAHRAVFNEPRQRRLSTIFNDLRWKQQRRKLLQELCNWPDFNIIGIFTAVNAANQKRFCLRIIFFEEF